MWFICFLSALTGIILLVSTVDLLDRVSNRDVALGVVVELALLKLPFLSQEVMPFTVLFASMTTFWRLPRSNELVVARAAVDVAPTAKRIQHRAMGRVFQILKRACHVTIDLDVSGPGASATAGGRR